ncbi:NapC/NirT family cytochrome c [Azospirillum sp. sgz301742]
MLGRVWTWITKPVAWGATALVAAVVALVGWGGFTVALDKTNTLEFCISCHEMKQSVYQEYTQSPHFQNRSGVRAVCADCHVAKDLGHKLIRKAEAAKEVWHALLGTVDTPEKFDEHRLEMAKRVWAGMEANDSRECRSCHAFATMDIEKQRESARKMHPQGIKDGETCITCHKGIAHKLPDMSGGYKKAFEELIVSSAKGTGTAERLYTLRSKPFFLDRADAKPDARGDGVLLPATGVTVLERSGDLVKVRVDGWQQDGVGQMVYAASGKRIFSAALGKGSEKAVEVKRSTLDPDTDLTWNEVALTAWIADKEMAADEKKLWNYANEMYGASCGTCHSLRNPNHFLANQWIGNLDSMKRFITLDKEEYRFLLKYLQLYAKDTGGAAATH